MSVITKSKTLFYTTKTAETPGIMPGFHGAMGLSSLREIDFKTPLFRMKCKLTPNQISIKTMGF